MVKIHWLGCTRGFCVQEALMRKVQQLLQRQKETKARLHDVRQHVEEHNIKAWTSFYEDFVESATSVARWNKDCADVNAAHEHMLQYVACG